MKNGLNATDAKIKIIDTSGRDSLDEDLIKEVREIKESVKPDNVLFVLDATMGQQAGPQAKH